MDEQATIVECLKQCYENGYLTMPQYNRLVRLHLEQKNAFDEKIGESTRKIRTRTIALARLLEREFCDQHTAEQMAQIFANNNGTRLFVYRASATTYGIDSQDSDLRAAIIDPEKESK